MSSGSSTSEAATPQRLALFLTLSPYRNIGFKTAFNAVICNALVSKALQGHPSWFSLGCQRGPRSVGMILGADAG